MSIKSIKSQIDFFLSKSEPSVMAIKGDWGIGKTYAWNKYLIEARKENRVPCGKYSYVSLFGIKTIEQLKEAIFSNAVPNEHAGEQPSLQSFQDNTKNLINSFSKCSWRFMKDLPYLNYAAPAIQAWSFMSVSNYLICIDDLERKGTSLEVKEVLGLVSLLKEQKNCKVVLLLNDGTKEVKDYSKYREKVIDVELYFSPLPQESANIAYDNSKDFHNELAEKTIKLGISNIRILKKIESIVGLLWPRLDRCEQEIKWQVIHSAALMGWSHFSPKAGTDIPSLKFIVSMDNIYMIGGKDSTEKEKAWKEIMLSYNFTRVDEFDKVIAELIKYGYFNLEHVDAVINRANQEAIHNKKANGMNKAWDVFHSSFKDNEAEVLQAFIDGVKESVAHVTANQLDSAITVIRDLGGREKATEILDFYIDSRMSTPEIFNLNSFEVYKPIQDKEINERFNDAYASAKPQGDFREVLSRLNGSNGWRDEDIDILDSVSQKEYFNFFKGLDGPDLTSTIATALKFSRIGNASEKMISVTSKVKGALIEIKGESKLNKMRMEKFNL
ncbi:hypothetical protein HA47_11520 [Pantoea stewartii subsp. indologenes]|uniref:hypothetical protein n=1 Tax=Pantoea stewartii TaxID=66269 RepID=UPI00050E17FF|nr:hypothetical protein [Pantoea stewartii]KGD83546.1 hypothetical protein HA47_11520 [Pantoea stewartii subsp. indologenes]